MRRQLSSLEKEKQWLICSDKHSFPSNKQGEYSSECFPCLLVSSDSENSSYISRKNDNTSALSFVQDHAKSHGSVTAKFWSERYNTLNHFSRRYACDF